MKTFTPVTPNPDQRILTKPSSHGDLTYLDFDPDFGIPVHDREDGIPPADRFGAYMNYEAAAPCMLPVESHILRNMTVNKEDSSPKERGMRNRNVLVMAEAGPGKTWMHHKIMTATGCNGILLTPDNNDDSDEFLAKATLNLANGTDLIAKINEALLGKGNLSDDAVHSLKQILDTNGYLRDSEHTERGADGLSRTDKVSVLDLSKLDSADRITKLESIAKSVGLISDKLAKPYLAMQSGPLMQKLIHARDTGEPLLITFDEANYYNWGPLSRNLLAVTGGHDAECTIPHYKPDGSVVQEKFTREQLSNVHVYMPMNKPGPEEPNPKVIAGSVLSRTQPVQFDVKYGAEDFAARLSKEFLGFPLTSHWNGDPQFFENNPDKAVEVFTNILTGGVTEAELKGRDDAQQTRLLSKAGEVATGCTLMGNMMNVLKTICRGEVDHKITREVNKYLGAAGSDIRPTMDGRSFHTLKGYAINDIHNTPKDKKTDTYLYRLTPEMRKYGTKAPENLGSRMTNALLLWIDTNFPPVAGLEATRLYIGQQLVENRILSREEVEKRFTSKDNKSELNPSADAGQTVAELINLGSTVGRTEELKAAQALLFSIAKKKFPADYADAKDPDQLFNLEAVASMLDEYRREAEKIRKTAKADLQPVPVLVPELEVVAKGAFALRIGRSEARKSSDTAASNLPKMSLAQQLMAVVADKGGDLSHLFTAKPLSKPVQDEIEARLAPLEKSRDEQIQINQDNPHEADQSKKDQRKLDIEAEFAQRMTKVREDYAERLQSLSAGTHPAGIHITTLTFAVAGGGEADFTLLRDVPPVETTGEQKPARYVLVGNKQLPEELTKYLGNNNMEYIDVSQEKGQEALKRRTVEMVSTGAQRMLEKVEADYAAIPEKTGDSDQQAAELKHRKEDAMQRYSDAWDKTLYGADDYGLFTLARGEGAGSYEKLIGSLRSKTDSDAIEAETDPEAKRKLLERHGGGVQEVALLQRPKAEMHERLVDRIAATASFVLEHGQYHAENKMLPIEPVAQPVAVAR